MAKKDMASKAKKLERKVEGLKQENEKLEVTVEEMWQQIVDLREENAALVRRLLDNAAPETAKAATVVWANKKAAEEPRGDVEWVVENPKDEIFDVMQEFFADRRCEMKLAPTIVHFPDRSRPCVVCAECAPETLQAMRVWNANRKHRR